MKRVKTRLISTLLVLAMLLGMIPVASAEYAYAGNGEGTITVTVRDSVSQTPIANAAIQLEDITAGRELNYGSLLTDENGQVSWAGLSSGWYRIIQTSVPEGYVLNSNEIIRYIDTEEETDFQVTITNRSQSSIYIYRIDPLTQEGLAGAGYIVYDSTGAQVGAGTTDENGFLVISNLEGGDYTIQEVAAPAGYSLSTPTTQTATLVASSTVSYPVIFTGSEKSSITIFNYDEGTGEGIAGSTWKIERVGGSFSSGLLTTNSAGLVTVEGLEPGTYLVTQTAVAAGYIKYLNSAEVVIGTSTTHKLVSLGNCKPGVITVYVGDSVTGEPLAGVAVRLYNSQNELVAGPVSTSTEGIATFEDVEDGNYTVVASAPNGYVMDTTTRAISITKGGDKSVDFTATPLGSILIRAISATDSSYIAGCEFAVFSMDGSLIGNYSTGTDGTAQVPTLENGYYIIQETSAPEGYVIESATKTVYVSAGSVASATFSHRDKPYITVQCYVQGTTTPIPNSVVTLTNETGSVVLTGTTESDGSYTFTDLDPGTYIVKYASAPEGYTIETSTQTVVVTKNKAGYATLYASRHSSIVITKVDNTTGAPLSGATFLIRDAQGNIEEIVTTDASGTAVTKILDPGRYTVSEQFAPDGYVPSVNNYNVTVENNKTALLSVTNEKYGCVVVYAYDNDGIPMPNISYILYDAVTGQELSTMLTDENGVAIFTGINAGAYIVSEVVVPDGYVVVNPTQSHITVSTEEATYVRFVHVPQATILMQTVDIYTGEPVIGAVYQVTSTDGSYVSTFETDDNGEALTETLPLGTYEVKQIVAPEGYLLNTTTHTITVYRDRINQAKFFNKPMSYIEVQCVESGYNFGLTGATITITNTEGKEVARGTTTEDGLFVTGDLEPGKYTVEVIAVPDGYACIQKQRTVEVTLGDATTVKFEFTSFNHIIINLTDASDPSKGLAGSTFRIEAIDGDFETEIVTDSSGHAYSDALPDGTYMVHQTVAPDGYILDQSYQWATLDSTANTVLDFTNRQISGLVIQALTEEEHTGIPGVTFEIWEQNGKLIKTVTTDTTGVVTIDNLDSGIYLVKEVYVPDGYTARTLTQTVTIDYDRPTTLNFYHTVEASLIVNLTDSKTGKPISGATFRISRQNGDYVGDYTTDISGKFTVAALEAGTYNLIQTSTPSGYVLNSISRTFEMKDGQITVVDLTNDPVGCLTIVNTCKQDDQPIEGNTFKLTTLSGELIDNYTTNAAGLITVTLEAGKYVLYQTSVVDGYVLNTDIWNITMEDGKSVNLEIQNSKLSAIVVNFIDADTLEPIYGVQMEIKDSKNNLVMRDNSNNEGKIRLSDVLDAGEYVLNMLSVPSGYEKDTIPKTIVVKVGETTEVTWALTGHKGQVTIVTYSGEDNAMMNIRKNSLIPGAVYQIKDASGNLVETIAGDINGAARTGVLGLGTYFIQQIIAPAGYQVNSTQFALTITNTNDNVRVEVYNLAGNYETDISVRGSASAYAGDSVKYYMTVENKSTCAMDNFYIHIAVPTDVLRAETLYTGTFSGSATTFYIEYKTNMNDYRTLATGLNSHSSYTYGLSTQALGLQSGEYCTDVRMVFSSVVAGFKQSTAPTIQCYVLSTAQAGYQAIMKVECGAVTGYYTNSSNGGTWGSTTGQTLANGGYGYTTSAAASSSTSASGSAVSSGWVTASGSCTTMIYGRTIVYPVIKLPTTLPKTGY